MADLKISELSAASALGGTEQIPVVQGGANKYATPAQVATYVGAGLGTASTLASDTDTTLAANSDARVATQKATKAYVTTAIAGVSVNVTLTGDVTGTGTGSFAATIANDAVTNAKLTNMAASTVKARKTGSTGDPEDCTLSELLDFIGSAAQGDILYRGASGWARLAAGTSGYFLKTLGAGANPAWATASTSSYTNSETIPVSPALGDRWYVPSTGRLYTRVDDGTSTQWVEF